MIYYFSLYLIATLTRVKKGRYQGIEVEGFENKNEFKDQV
jgi:hypothetical protein